MSTPSDNNGDLWLDAKPPLELMRESTAPGRLALKACVAEEPDAQGQSVWLRFSREEAHRLLDRLTDELQSARTNGADAMARSVVVDMATNGGVNSANGNMVLLFEAKSGLKYRLELPSDQSGNLIEMAERAAKAAVDLASDGKPSDILHLRPREAAAIVLGTNQDDGRPVLVVRAVDGPQFSFILDQSLVEALRRQSTRAGKEFKRPSVGDSTIADDLEWLKNEWCVVYEPPSDQELRRGSAALRRLLVEGHLLRAWRKYGFVDQPTVEGPDVRALAAHEGLHLGDAVSLVAGGGCLNRVQSSLIGIFKVYNPETGKGPDADEGFAAKTTFCARDVRDPEIVNDLTLHCRKAWRLLDYLQSCGAVRLGKIISREEIIKFFANYAGGVHLDRGAPPKGKTSYALIADLEGKVRADGMEGLHFELFSIGYAIGNSPDLHRLIEKIRTSDEQADA
jgi:Holliday junction resolvase